MLWSVPSWSVKGKPELILKPSGTYWAPSRSGWMRVSTQSAAMGALPTLFAATVPDLAGGSYIGPGSRMETRGHPRPVGSSERSHDRGTAKALWAKCEELTGQEFTV